MLLVLWLASIACSNGYVSPARLTATASNGGPEAVSAVGGIPDLPAATEAPAQPVPTATEAQPELPIVTIDPTIFAELTAAPTAAPTEPAPAPTAAPQIVKTAQPQPTGAPSPDNQPPILYYTQAGDTLKAVAARFNVLPAEITSPEPIPPEGWFNPGVLLLIPPRLGETSSSVPLIPDSEVVYSPSALDFDIEAFIKESSGYLDTYREWRSAGWFDGAGIVRRVAVENSVNPRLLIMILEQQSHWVTNLPQNLAQTDYPIGWLENEPIKAGLYNQLSWAVEQLNIGYYGWREGTVTELKFPDGQVLRLAPDLNAGTVSLMYLFSRLYNQQEWAGILYGPDGIMTTYEQMMGNPWLRSLTVEPLFPATLTQPPLALPFLPGHTWSYTGGPHSAWGQGDEHPRAALDFAPSAVVKGCYKAEEWATASAPGVIVRSENGIVVIDMDGDGYEQTGWTLMYLHIAADGRVPIGTWVNTNDRIGHPSCEGGFSTGTHIHMARKYNGEWILAGGPMPFDLDGWRAHADTQLYIGTLIKGDQVIYSSLVGSYESRITRPRE